MFTRCRQPVPGDHSLSLTMAVVLYSAVVSSLLCLVRAQSDNCGTSVGPLVTRGRPVIQGEYPWLAALYMREDKFGNFDQFCGGALITRNLVLTAAHCLVFEGEVVKPLNIRVGLGKLYRDFYHNEDDAVIAYVRAVIVPERFVGSLSSFALDVALLRLSVVVEVSDYVLPVCIDLDTITSVGAGAAVHAAGWGTSENGTSTDRALAADMSYLDYQECLKQVRLSYRKYITHDKICSLSIDGSQVDRGDSGGPLTFSKNGRHFVVGVVSTKTRDQTAFSIFTDLSNPEIHFWLKTQSERLNFSSKGTIINYKMPVESSKEEVNTPIKNYTEVSERAVDCVTNTMYYWSNTHRVIVEESSVGKHRKNVTATGSEFLGQTVDWIERNIYFIDVIDKKRALRVVSLYTGRVNTIIPEITTDTSHPTVHPSLRKLYMLTDNKRVEYIELDISSPTLRLFHETEKPWVDNIAIDWQTNELCLMYGGNDTAAIKCKHLVTRKIRTVLAGFPRVHSIWGPKSFIITPSDYQWGDAMKVHKLPKSSSVVENVTYFSNVGEIVFFPTVCPNLTPPPRYFKNNIAS